jgi:hypothetical protein
MLKTEQLITVSVEGASLSTSVVWNGIGDDDIINANEMVAATLSGTVAIIGAVNSIRPLLVMPSLFNEPVSSKENAITTDTGILTYKTIQTSAHDNDTVTIVATDVAGNETEQLITVSVKIFARGFVINGKNVNDESGHSVSTAGDVNGDGLLCCRFCRR